MYAWERSYAHLQGFALEKNKDFLVLLNVGDVFPTLFTQVCCSKNVTLEANGTKLKVAFMFTHTCMKGLWYSVRTHIGH